ncbi:MAG: SDR family oxidoreductase [Myxococcota bacterium]|nr:SDR family oxidoreductase [Myxococcota bacterium]
MSIFHPGLLEDRVAIVTGGGSGIGASISYLFSQLGARVIIASRKEERIQKAAAGLSALTQNEVQGLVCDIRNRESVQSLVKTVMQKHGKIDILVNNGGGQFMSPAEHIRPKGWDSVISTNLTGTWNMCQAVAKAHMLKHRGKIINITMLTDRGFPGMSHSCASRAGVEGMTKSLAVEWATKGISINCIQPGIIASNGMRNYPGGEAIARQVRSEIPMKRLGHCDEVANLVAFLASPAGNYITGQIWAIDGGRNLWGKTWPLPDPKNMEPVQIQDWPWEQED